MPEFLQKAIEKVNARPGKLKKDLEELNALRKGEVELNGVISGPLSRVEGPNRDSDAVFEQSRKRAAELMNDDDVEGEIKDSAVREDECHALEKEKMRFEHSKEALEELILRNGLFEKISFLRLDRWDVKGEREMTIGMTLKPDIEWGGEFEDEATKRMFGYVATAQEKYADVAVLFGRFADEYDISIMHLKLNDHNGKPVYGQTIGDFGPRVFSEEWDKRYKERKQEEEKKKE